MDAMTQAGLRRQDLNITNLVPKQPRNNVFQLHKRKDVEEGIQDLRALIRRTQPNLVVALGNEASFALVDDWPSRDDTIYGATGIQDRRGYLWWNAELGCKVLTTLHPAACLMNRDPSGISGMLLLSDLLRAKEEAKSPELERPKRSVEVVTSTAQAEKASAAIRQAGIATADIECYDDQTLQCVGFAISPEQAYVFTEQTFEAAFRLLEDPEVGIIFQNGQFDLKFLKSRNGVTVQGYCGDPSIQWHCLWPEIAGAGIDSSGNRRGSKRTHKSLHFFASLYTKAQWWKDYETDDAGMYELNGKDCCITHEVWQKLDKEIDELGVRPIYEHELRLVWVCVDIDIRGIRVDDELRQESLAALEEERETYLKRLMELAEPLLRNRRDRLEKEHLFFQVKQCPCCNGGKKKAAQCWSCAGFESAPSKADLVDRGGDPTLLKAELEETILGRCTACGGVGSEEHFVFNPNSNDQQKELLYNILRVPKRYKGGSLTTDEEALKGLLGVIS